jgi:carbonic anhydrase/acetyltransferase-like protein (isoleucine patch superfamily)
MSDEWNLDDTFLEDNIRIHPTAYVFPQTFLSGDVSIGEECSVWPMCVLRGDRAPIIVGPRSNIQDGCLIHADPGYTVRLGTRVSLGHGAIVHGATIEDEVLIGIGAVVLNGAHIGRGSIVGARALVTEGMQVPPDSLVLGIPGKIRPISEERAAGIPRTAEGYVRRKEHYRGRDHR